MGRSAALGAVGLLTGCPEDVFRCSDDGQCPSGGVCESTGFCSVPVSTEECPSGRRYAELSGELSGECVPHEGAETEGENTTEPAATTSPDDGTPPTSGEPSTSSSTSAAETSDDSTTGNDPIVFVDDDASEFDAGTHEATAFDDGLRLQPDATTGTFVSRVFDAGAPAAWTFLSWAPRAPYSKPLPDDGLDEVGYAEGAVSMEANVLLLHFDVGPGLAPGDGVAETSGFDHPVTLQGTSAVAAANPAIFGEGLALTPSSFVSVDAVDDDAFRFGDDDFTWSMWARSTTPCYSSIGGVFTNQVYMGIEQGGGSGSHAWLGCFNPAATICGADEGDGRLGGTITASQGDGLGGLCGGPELVDGGWHHLALVKSGHENATLRIFFDGQEVQSVDVSYALPVLFSEERPFQIGRLSDGFRSTVDLDEVSVFRRRFEAEEISDLYLRGALGLTFQVRACETPSCDDVPFVGPGFDETTTFRDGPNGPSVEAGPRHGRYFQYMARFSRPASEVSREAILDEVRVTALLE